MRTHDGLDLHVEIHGADPGIAPVTVVLAHCWTADVDDWRYQVRALLGSFGRDIRILTWDHRGHGCSDAAPLAACTVDHLARDMADLVDLHAPSGPLVIAGHSIGGMTMMALAEQRPDLVSRCVGALFVSTSSGRMDSVTLGLPARGAATARAALPRLLAHRARRLSRRRRKRAPIIETEIVRRFLFGDGSRLRDQAVVVEQIINCPSATMAGF